MPKRGVVSVTRGPADLVEPVNVPASQQQRYGLVIPFQIAPRKAALYCNVRQVGVPCIDFEAGADIVPFDDLAAIDPLGATVIARNHAEDHPRTGKALVMVKHVLLGGFVPTGARRPDGSPHPHAGTGFAIGPVIGYAADFSQRLPGGGDSHRYMEIHQLAGDGRSVSSASVERAAFEAILPPWRIVNRGLSAAIPDGDDLLFGLVACRGEEKACSGVSRWRRGDRLWRPVSFTPVTPADTSMEPNIHRDLDGTLLFGARCGGHDQGDAVTFGIRVWRSTDGGASWRQVVSAPRARASTPVVLNQAADGTPYVCANPWREAVHDSTGRKAGIWSHRQSVLLWPLNERRDALLPPITVRDCDADFGPPPPGRLWFADHPVANTVQLADGAWRNLLGYRVRISNPTPGDWEFVTPITGGYVEEVISSGEARPRWSF